MNAFRKFLMIAATVMLLSEIAVIVITGKMIEPRMQEIDKSTSKNRARIGLRLESSSSFSYEAVDEVLVQAGEVEKRNVYYYTLSRNLFASNALFSFGLLFSSIFFGPKQTFTIMTNRC